MRVKVYYSEGFDYCMHIDFCYTSKVWVTSYKKYKCCRYNCKSDETEQFQRAMAKEESEYHVIGLVEINCTTQRKAHNCLKRILIWLQSVSFLRQIVRCSQYFIRKILPVRKVTAAEVLDREEPSPAVSFLLNAPFQRREVKKASIWLLKDKITSCYSWDLSILQVLLMTA